MMKITKRQNATSDKSPIFRGSNWLEEFGFVPTPFFGFVPRWSRSRLMRLVHLTMTIMSFYGALGFCGMIVLANFPSWKAYVDQWVPSSIWFTSMIMLLVGACYQTVFAGALLACEIWLRWKFSRLR